MWLPVFTVTTLSAIIGSHFVSHQYYLLALVPWSTLLVGAGLTALREWYPRLGIAACIGVTALTPGLFWKYYRGDDQLPAYRSVGSEVGVRTDTSELVLVEAIGDRGAWYLHPIRRRGWIETRSVLDDARQVEELRQRGLRWVVWHDGHEYHLSDVDSWMGGLERAH